MPRRSDDSGYEGSNRNITMARQDSNTSQSFLGHNGDPFNKYYMSGQFHLSDYRDAQSSVSGIESLTEEHFHSPMALLNEEHSIDPRLAGSPALAGLCGAADANLAFDTFTLNEHMPSENLTPGTSGQGLPGDQSLNLPPDADVSSPWTLYRVNDINDNMSKRPQPDDFQTPDERIKRRACDYDPGYGSQGSRSPYGSLSSHPNTLRTQPNPYSLQQPPPSFTAQDGTFFTSPPQQSHYSQALRAPEFIQPGPQTSIAADTEAKPALPAQEVPRTPRKHDRKHPCELCPAGVKVFTTLNDLVRHRKTVHGQLNPRDRIWICNVESCNVQTKIWPRLDNFKQHVSRMHKDIPLEHADSMEQSYDPAKHGHMEVVVRSRNRIGVSNMRLGSDSGAMMIGHQNPQPRRPGHMARANRSFSGPNQSQVHGILEQMTQASTPKSSMRNNPRSSASLDASRSSAAEQKAFVDASDAMSNPALLSPTNNAIFRGGRRGPATVADPHTLIRQQRELQHNVTVNPQFVPASTEDFVAMGHFVEGPSSLAAAGLVGRPGSDGNGNSPLELDAAASLIESDPVDDLEANLVGLPDDLKQRIIAAVARIRGSAMTEPYNQRSAQSSSKKGKADGEKGQKNLKCSKKVIVAGREVSCDKWFATNSELKKHENRHQKYYGCTFDHCYKRFGTKWEWKRHEHNQHVQVECWRCRSKNGHGKICAQLFHEKTAFTAHIVEDHNIPPGDLDSEIEDCHLARMWVGSFWCGFCNNIIKSSEARVPGMEKERNSHVSDHIDGNGGPKFDMSEWVELSGGGKTKKQVRDDERENSGQPDPSKPESVGADEDSDTDDEPETEVETSSVKPERPRVNTGLTRAVQESATSSGHGQRRESLALTPTPMLQVIDPDGQVSEPGSAGGISSLARGPQPEEDVQGYMRTAMAACPNCMNVMCLCDFTGQMSQEERFGESAFDDSMMYDSFPQL